MTHNIPDDDMSKALVYISPEAILDSSPTAVFPHINVSNNNTCTTKICQWHISNGSGCINKVTLHWVWTVQGWVTAMQITSVLQSGVF